ncbi:MAG: dockerin type I domain-containing protein, partial [Tepidisphaeraceae bacterium]
IVQYKADETGGSTLADATPNGKNATLTGSYAFTTGTAGNAVNLTGGYATLPTGIVNGLTDFTIAGWVKLNARNANARLYELGNSSTTGYMYLLPSNGSGNVQFGMTSGGSSTNNRIVSTTAVPLNTWTHLAVTLSGTTATLYVNGVAVGTNTAMTLTPGALGATANNWLGKSQFSTDPMLSGAIDDFRIYNTALSGSAVTGLYNATPGPTIAIPAAASATTVYGKTVDLSVLGAFPSGESNLTYIWSTVGNLASPLTFSANGTNAAKNTTATFSGTGSYAFQVAVYDTATGQIVRSGVVNVVVVQGVGPVTPGSATVIAGGVQAFTILDQFGQALPAAGITWTTTAGVISSAGVLTAPAGGTATVTATVGTLSSSATVTTITPRAWYKNDAATGTAVADASGNVYNGTLTGSYSWGGGLINNALTLSGGYATVPAGAINGLNDFTVSTWVKPTATTNWGRLFDFGTGTTKYMFLAPADGSGYLRYAITTGGGGGEQLVTTTTAIPAGAWTHIALTQSGTTVTLYVNGVAVGTNASITLNPAGLGATTLNYLGKSQYSDPTFKGGIDDFRIYGAAADPATVAALYAAGQAYATAAPSNVVAVAASASQVNLSWTDNTTAEAGYLVERATNATFTAGLTSFTRPAGSSSYADTSVAASTTYYYRVTTILAGVTSAGPVAAPAVTTPAAVNPPALTTFTVNNGNAQRSTVTSLTLVFSRAVHLGTGAIVLSGVSGTPANISYVLSPANDASTYTLTFPAQVGGSLADGGYQLKLNAALVTDVATGQPMAADDTRTFYRLFGDGDGNGTVNFNDFLALQTAFNTTSADPAYNAAFDANGDNKIDFNDFLAFQTHFGMNAGT